MIMVPGKSGIGQPRDAKSSLENARFRAGLSAVGGKGDLNVLGDTPWAIKVDGLSKVYRSGGIEVVAIRDINLHVRPGEFLAIVGPSGCGKSTLLRILAGLDKPTNGTVEFAVESEKRPLRSMVFQEQGVFPWMKVQENVEFGLAARGISKRAREEIARQYIVRLGLGDFANVYPRRLSGGMLQRVNLARAFANDPAILLMDEPLASLDEQTKMVAQVDLISLWEETDKVVVFVTHSLDEAVALGDRVVVISARPARIKAVIDIDLGRPRDLLELRNDLRFMEKRKQVWDALRDEVVKVSGISREVAMR